MKLSVGSLFGSSKASSKKKKTRSLSRAAGGETPSFGSSSSGSASSRLQSTPRSVLRPDTYRIPSYKSGSEDYSSSSSASSDSVLPFSVSDLFSVFDRNGDGKITREELEIVLRRLGPDPPTDEEVASMVAEVDRDGDGCISLEEFGVIGPSAFGPPAGPELRDAFAVFDADGDGKISAEELLGVFLALGDGGCTLEDCRRMIGGVDSDGDGFVCYEDFVRMMDGQRYKGAT